MKTSYSKNYEIVFYTCILLLITLFWGCEKQSINNEKMQVDKELNIPDKPGGFYFNTQKVLISNLKFNDRIESKPHLKRSINDEYLPTIIDIQEDGEEIFIDSEIINLAASLENNPLNIFNFIRNTINYEPYYGAKKGSLGCLHETSGNDVDISSLAISILRAAGIPARYKKSIIVASDEQLKTLIGVDDLKSVYAAYYWNKVPVFTIDGSNLGDNFQTANFSGIDKLALEWVFVEIFYEYDERAANINNSVSLKHIETTNELRALLNNYPKKQWIPFDAVMKPLNHNMKEIIHDTANFNTEQFWNDFFKYNGSLSPIEKYIADLQTTTGKNIQDDAYQSTLTISQKDFQILPYKLPYLLGSGVSEDGVSIEPETWSVFPDSRRYIVKISLLNKDDQSIILEHSFWGSKINNHGVKLLYEGANDTDKIVIKSYGGIHATPASMVYISPYFNLDFTNFKTENSLKIGDSCILRFEYIINGEVWHTDEKFSIAGNNEGIFVILSKVKENSTVDNNADNSTDSTILLEGNIELARQYIRRTSNCMDLLMKSLDIAGNINFFRAVVTQNRTLTKVNDIPTTFDFKGLSIDAVSYITDYSRRNDFSLHRKDFHLLWGLQASYYEAQIFTDIAGLNAISTVKGLQHAYANPSEYVVYNINTNNEYVIDTLTISNNTKLNMHTDVQNGRTIITPNTFVSSGNWNGLFYVSLENDGTGTYAIGEQVINNGGWSLIKDENVEEIIVNDDETEAEKVRMKIEVDDGESFFIYSDDIMSEKKCRIKKSDFENVLEDEEYKHEYGVPCIKDYKKLGNQTIHYVLTTDGIKYYKENDFVYWITESNVLNILKDKKENRNYENLTNITIDEKTFKFNSQSGTFTCNGTAEKDGKTIDIVEYYLPNNQNGDAVVVYGHMLSKLHKLNILSYPTTIRMLIVNNAQNNMNAFSGQSEICREASNCWYTDTYGGDGARMSNAITCYHDWYNKDDSKRVSLSKIQEKMREAFSGSAYLRREQDQLVQQILDQYLHWDWNLHPEVTTDDQVLQFMGIQKQCLEWASSIALISNGKAKSYNSYLDITDEKIMPGVGYAYFNTSGGGSHAMIIIDVEYDNDKNSDAFGKPVQITVAESNWAKGWTNPGGGIPWQRRVSSRTRDYPENERITKVVYYE